MKTHILGFLQEIGLLREVPEEEPAKGQVLARAICFFHEGADNPNGLLLFADGYVCATAGCHRNKPFGCNLEGLIRRMVYRISGQNMGWSEAWAHARKNAKKLEELVEGKVNQRVNKVTAARQVQHAREALMQSLEVPDAFYLKRGYRPETLLHFGVGTCRRPLPDGKRLIGWAVIPVTDSEGRPFGYTARNPRWHKGSNYPKWVHAVRRNECVFNYHQAHTYYDAHKRQHGPLVICEGPGDVMRFHEAGYRRAVATFGTVLSRTQYFHLLSLFNGDIGNKVYIAGDADEAGRNFAEHVKHELRGVCAWAEIVFPTSSKDFGDATVEEIQAMNL